MRITYSIGGAVLVMIAVVAGVLAFTTVEGGAPASIDATTARNVRASARAASDFPPLAFDIESARLDAAVSGGVAAATVRWRTIFNVPFGVTRIEGQSQSNSISLGRLVGVWAGFGAGELLLLASAGWLWLCAADER